MTEKPALSSRRTPTENLYNPHNPYIGPGHHPKMYADSVYSLAYAILAVPPGPPLESHALKSADHLPVGVSHLTPRRRRNEWLALALGMVVLTAAVAMMVFDDRAKLGSFERGQLQTQARVIEENLVRQLQAAGTMLSGLRQELVSGDTGLAPEAQTLRLKVLTDALPGVRAIYAIDSGGVVLVANQARFIGRSVEERKYFTVPRDKHDDKATYLSPPYLSTMGNYVVNLSKSMSDADGRFAGVTTAVLDQSYFDILARSVLYAPDMTVNISHADGQVLLIAPSYARATGLNQNAPGTPFTHHRDSGAMASFFEETTADNPQPRMVALRSVSPPALHLDKPLVITVSRPTSAIYSAWLEQALLYALFWGLLLIAAALALLFHQARRSAEAAAQMAVEAAQRETAKRFEHGLKGADLGLWEWNLAEDRLIINDRQWQILGYQPGEIELNRSTWQALLHPDDWPALEAAFVKHLREGSPAYKLEHRLRHKDGHWVWVLDHSMVVERDAHGRALRVLGTHMDITARKQAEEAQRDTAQRLELAMQSGKIGLLDWHLPSGTLILNALGHDILGRLPDKVDGEADGAADGATDMPPLSATEWEQLRHLDDAAAVAAAHAALVHSEYKTADLEYRMRHVDGHYVYIHMRAEIVARDAMDRPLRLVGIFRDVSARKRTEAALANAMALQRRTGELARVGGWELDLPHGTPVWTEEVYRICDMEIGQPLGLSEVLAGHTPQERTRFASALHQATTVGAPWDMELQMTTVLGRKIWVRSLCEVVLEDGRPRRLMGTLQDTTERMAVQLELQRANAQLAELSLTDGLTEVANRRHFDQAIAGEWPRSVRQRLPLALLMIDIDHFKAYNDALGHQGGDACLRDVAHILARCAWRPGELLARYGGEEFCILLPDSTLEDAKVVAQRCLDRVEQARIPHPASPSSQWLSVSIGVASLVPALGSLPDVLLERADTALYRAKREGRARFVCAEADGANDDITAKMSAEIGAETSTEIGAEPPVY